MKTPENAVSVQLESKPVLTVDDLKDSDHVGFIGGLGKGHIAAYCVDEDLLFMGLYVRAGSAACNTRLGSGRHYALPDVLKKHTAASQITQVFKFDNRIDLYKWLSEE